MEQKDQEAVEEVGVAESTADQPSKKKKVKRWPIITGVAVLLVAAIGVGGFVWHEQPSFCNAICHTPMDPYLTQWESQAGQPGVDKNGNEVSNSSSMLAISHKAPVEEGGAGAACLTCHKPSISEQIHEGMNWVTGNYEFPLYERTVEEMVYDENADPDSFCLNESCHNMTRKDLIALTADFERNPHVPQHGEQSCGSCHKAHRASTNSCSQCHKDSPTPDGWLSYDEAKKLAK